MSEECSSDWSLVEQFAAGADDCFEEIVCRFEREIFQLSLVLTRTPEEAEETLGAVFCDAYRELPALVLDDCGDGAAPSLRAWFYTRTIDRALSLREEAAGLVQDSVVVTSEAEQGSAEAELEKILRRLPLEYRLVYLLRQISGREIDECATFLRLSPLEVRAYLHRARLMIIRAFRKSSSRDEIPGIEAQPDRPIGFRGGMVV